MREECQYEGHRSSGSFCEELMRALHAYLREERSTTGRNFVLQWTSKSSILLLVQFPL
jgi:hypothetical protein